VGAAAAVTTDRPLPRAAEEKRRPPPAPPPPPTHTQQPTRPHSAHSTQPALRPRRATLRVEDQKSSSHRYFVCPHRYPLSLARRGSLPSKAYSRPMPRPYAEQILYIYISVDPLWGSGRAQSSPHCAWARRWSLAQRSSPRLKAYSRPILSPRAEQGYNPTPLLNLG